MRGYHPTTIPADGDYKVLTLGRDVLALIEALGRASAVVIGHDWGAYASYAAAMLGPERVSKLVTVAIPHPRSVRARNLTPGRAWRGRHFLILRHGGAAARLRRDDFAGLEAICRRWSPTWALPPTELDSIKRCFSVPGALEAALGYYRALPLLLLPSPRLLEKTTVPSLTIYGTDDGVVDAAIFESAREGFAGRHELVPIAHAGHFVHREQPELFARALLPFLTA
jgi:pimeloyl-ACP methyl ester carboxylesterase